MSEQRKDGWYWVNWSGGDWEKWSATEYRHGVWLKTIDTIPAIIGPRIPSPAAQQKLAPADSTPVTPQELRYIATSFRHACMCAGHAQAPRRVCDACAADSLKILTLADWLERTQGK